MLTCTFTLGTYVQTSFKRSPLCDAYQYGNAVACCGLLGHRQDFLKGVSNCKTKSVMQGSGDTVRDFDKHLHG